MKLCILVILIIEIQFILIHSCKCETYDVLYVKPTEDMECPGQPCETLQYYLDTVYNESVEFQYITFILLNGTHTLRSAITFHAVQSVLKITAQKNHDVIIQFPYAKPHVLLFVLQGSTMYVENLTLRYLLVESIDVRDCFFFYWYFDCYRSTLQFSSVNLIKSRFYIISMSQTLFDNIILNHTLFFFKTTDYAVFYNTTLFEYSRISIMMSAVTFINSSSFSDSEVIAISGEVKLNERNIFANTSSSAIKCYKSNITVSGKVLFVNNTGAAKGSALALYSSSLKLVNGANLTFMNNFAIHKGGAIYVEPGLSPFVYALGLFPQQPHCFYELLDCSDDSKYTVHFINNTAYFGGDDMYGASFHSLHCQHEENELCNVTVVGASSNISSVSSDPTRVCLCDSQGMPQCDQLVLSMQVSAGEVFSIQVVLVGENYGTTTGILTVYSTVAEAPRFKSTCIKPGHQSPVNSKECTELSYSLYTNYTYVPIDLYLAADFTYAKYGGFFNDTNPSIARVKLSIWVLPCPSGFLLTGDPPGCECYHNLCNNFIHCTIINGTGLFSWNDSLIWVGTGAENKTTCNEFCPVDYCNFTGAWIDITGNPDAQCAFNRAGRLCGGCKKGYSLAIGSSHCIHCPNSNNLALLIFFLLAGVLLVLFIAALNFTVTQNAISGLIFYANIVWIYRNIFFPKSQETNHVLVIFLRTFIAWINLDFGIETCFVQGLTAFWKQWLQFIFPFYIWFIVSLIIMAARHSTRITRLLPQKRTIPTLATVFLLSYIKLLGIISSALKFSFILKYPNDTIENPKPSVTAVWSVDGNLTYCGHPHILLFLAGLATLLLLWLPYTLMTSLMQWFRMISHLRFLTWIERFVPISDANTAPLKHKHQYWFGVLLLVRGILLLIATSSFGIPYAINLLILLVFATLLLFYTNLMQIYKSTGVLLLNSSFTLNLVILSGVFILAYSQPNSQRLQMIAAGLSTGCAFLQFCGIVLYMLIKECVPRKFTTKPANEDDYDDCQPLEAINN